MHFGRVTGQILTVSIESALSDTKSNFYVGKASYCVFLMTILLLWASLSFGHPKTMQRIVLWTLELFASDKSFWHSYNQSLSFLLISMINRSSMKTEINIISDNFDGSSKRITSNAIPISWKFIRPNQIRRTVITHHKCVHSIAFVSIVFSVSEKNVSLLIIYLLCKKSPLRACINKSAVALSAWTHVSNSLIYLFSNVITLSSSHRFLLSYCMSHGCAINLRVFELLSRQSKLISILFTFSNNCQLWFNSGLCLDCSLLCVQLQSFPIDLTSPDAKFWNFLRTSISVCLFLIFASNFLAFTMVLNKQSWRLTSLKEILRETHKYCGIDYSNMTFCDPQLRSQFSPSEDE